MSASNISEGLSQEHVAEPELHFIEDASLEFVGGGGAVIVNTL